MNLVNYRKIDKLSASGIKLFDKDRMQFYKEFVLKEKRKEKNTESIIIGNLVDFALSDCNGDWEQFEQRFDEKFVLLSDKKGSGQMYELVDELFNITLKLTDEEGNCNMSFLDRFTEAFNIVQRKDKFKGKTVEFALEKFNGSNEELYFQQRLESIGKTVVDEWVFKKVESIVKSVIEDDNINHLFLPQENQENLGKVVIEWKYKEIECKSEIDKLIIDHNNKKIIITEIKTNWDHENFEYTYLKLRYDLAASFYYLAVLNYFINKTYPEYYIDFQFLVIDTSPNGLRALIKPLNYEDIEKSLIGFKINGWEYKGLNKLIEEIEWCQNTGNWNISKEAFENKSIVPIKLNYQ